MAPQTITCRRLAHSYSPLSSRGINHLPGCRTRAVPFVRPASRVGRQHTVVQAVAVPAVERFIRHGKLDEEAGRSNNGSGPVEVRGWAGQCIPGAHSPKVPVLSPGCCPADPPPATTRRASMILKPGTRWAPGRSTAASGRGVRASQVRVGGQAGSWSAALRSRCLWTGLPAQMLSIRKGIPFRGGGAEKEPSGHRRLPVATNCRTAPLLPQTPSTPPSCSPPPSPSATPRSCWTTSRGATHPTNTGGEGAGCAAATTAMTPLLHLQHAP